MTQMANHKSSSQRLIVKAAVLSIIIIISILLSSCGATNTPEATQTPPPTATFTATNTPLPTSTPTATLTPTQTATPTKTATPTPLPSPTQTPTATIDPSWKAVNNKYLTLYYPPDWTLLPAREHACIDPADCILHLSHATTEKVTIEFLREAAGIPAFSSVTAADNYSWQNIQLGAMLVQQPDKLKLISITRTVIGGEDAVIRQYEYPLVDPATYALKGLQYNYQALILKDGDSYEFRLTTTDPDEFKKYAPVADAIVKTIVFQKQ